MIQILIIDDNPQKTENVKKTLCEVPEIQSNNVDVAEDLISARDIIRGKQYDLLILDLKIPNRKGDDPNGGGGIDFIKELNRSQTLLRPFHILGLTEYEDAALLANPIFDHELWRIILYDPSSVNWKLQLQAKVKYLVKSKMDLSSPSNVPYLYDIAILCALPRVELKSILTLPAKWSEENYPNDSTIYNTGVFKDKDDGDGISVVAASMPQMGMTAAAVLAMKLINRFRPRYLAITGIAAGVEGSDAQLGDIVVADSSWDYESGKHKLTDAGPVFSPDPQSLPLQLDLKEKLLRTQSKGEFIHEIVQMWPGAKPKSTPQMFVGPFASGAAVVQNPDVIKAIQSHSRKVIGIDMETYGVFYAAENCTKPRPIAISVKAISDFANPQKSDDFQAYAAFVSANYLYRLTMNVLDFTL
jgi:nucleoside phosphorylase